MNKVLQPAAQLQLNLHTIHELRFHFELCQAARMSSKMLDARKTKESVPCQSTRIVWQITCTSSGEQLFHASFIHEQLASKKFIFNTLSALENIKRKLVTNTNHLLLMKLVDQVVLTFCRSLPITIPQLEFYESKLPFCALGSLKTIFINFRTSATGSH